ncbi:hypothetical protein [Gemella morbillorum]|uniref:hypothetical protein n=1 Tax=Gemella morbillorum TaxID=29391 RepID=UPI00248EF3D9|nr:hypothetical protein [Gemella morbillorum]
MEGKFATFESDLIKYIEINAREYQLPPFVVVGILSKLVCEWKSKELVQVVDSYNEVIKQLNEKLTQLEEVEK